MCLVVHCELSNSGGIMSIFNIFASDINAGIEEYKATPSSILLDVRTKEDFQKGTFLEVSIFL